MAGMQRFVTYLYLYKGNERLHNSGFAKMEIRGGQCRMELHLKGVAAAPAESSLYLFAREGKNMHAVGLGGLIFSGGTCDYRTGFGSAGIGGSPYSIQDMKGVYIPLDDTYMLASQWDEEEIDRSRIALWEENDDGSDREDASEEEPQNVEKAAATVESSQDSAKEAVRNEREQPEESNTEVQSDNSRMQTEQRDNNRMQAEADKPEVSVQATGLKEETQPRESLLDAFLRLQKREHTVELYEIGKHRVSSIHIELRDIRELPKQYWNLGNNSFLLHGFFNYRYLLLGKKLENDKETVFIGVPGVYHNQERMIAALFGFPEFLPENRKLEQTESPGELFETLRTAEARREAGRQEQPKELFGYWCHALVE